MYAYAKMHLNAYVPMKHMSASACIYHHLQAPTPTGGRGVGHPENLTPPLGGGRRHLMHIYIYICIYIYIYIGGLGEQVRLVRPPAPRDRLRFVFVFVSCVPCVPCVRARRGEAAWPSVCRPLSYRWAFLELGSTRLPLTGRRYFQRRRMGFNDIYTDFVPSVGLLLQIV